MASSLCTKTCAIQICHLGSDTRFLVLFVRIISREARKNSRFTEKLHHFQQNCCDLRGNIRAKREKNLYLGPLLHTFGTSLLLPLHRTPGPPPLLPTLGGGGGPDPPDPTPGDAPAMDTRYESTGHHFLSELAFLMMPSDWRLSTA